MKQIYNIKLVHINNNEVTVQTYWPCAGCVRLPLDKLEGLEICLYGSHDHFLIHDEENGTYQIKAERIMTHEQYLDLRKELNYHTYRYYVMDDPIISDQKYDMKYKELEAAEKEHPEWITTNSPTQYVGGGPFIGGWDPEKA